MEQITFDKRNYRKHSDENKRVIKKSLEELGAGRSVLIDKNNTLIAGNGVFEQAQALGIPVRVIETDGTELVAVKRTDIAGGDEKRKKLAMADNVASDLSDFDDDLLHEDFSMEELSDWGLELPEIEEAPTEEAQEDDFDEEKDKVETVCKKGDIWQLGNHRLMCGDSTDDEDVARLMDGEKADMCFTDPPYGMNLDTDYSSMQGFSQGGKYEAGHVDDFCPEMVQAVISLGAKETFMWGADYYAELLPKKNEGSWIVWDKRSNDDNTAEQAESSDKMFGSCFELCWSSQKHKRDIARVKLAGLFGMNKTTDSKRVHPTQKPIALVAWFLNRYSKQSETVADLFGGSGSTLIACEQLGRKCYMMELDPHYCDVIIARWEKLTGQKATKL